MEIRSTSALATALALSIATTSVVAQPRVTTSSPSQSRGDSPGGVTVLKPPATGEQVYTQVCQSCHMANAMGGVGAGHIPALANNPHLANAAYPLVFIVKGHGAMPYFTDLLAPAQIAAVTMYIRTHFGNAYAGPVTEADVARIAGPNPPK